MNYRKTEWCISIRLIYFSYSIRSQYTLSVPTENLTAFWCFQGVEKGGAGNKWVNGKYLLLKFWKISLQNTKDKPILLAIFFCYLEEYCAKAVVFWYFAKSYPKKFHQIHISQVVTFIKKGSILELSRGFWRLFCS